jgi:hypothetical protein
MSKVVTATAYTKMIIAFDEVQKTTIKAGDGGLTRNELRLLEREGFLERLRTEKRKWADVTPSLQYVYRRKK